MVGGLKERKTELEIFTNADSTSWLYLFVKLDHLKSCIEKNQRCNVLFACDFRTRTLTSALTARTVWKDTCPCPEAPTLTVVVLWQRPCVHFPEK